LFAASLRDSVVLTIAYSHLSPLDSVFDCCSALTAATPFPLKRLQYVSSPLYSVSANAAAVALPNRIADLELFHDELRAALIVAAKAIKTLNFGKRDTQVHG
jgi:hypothetical protein